MAMAGFSAMPRGRKTVSEQARTAANARAGKNRVAGKGHPTTAEMDYNADDLEFMKAIQEFKLRTGRQFPTWSEVLKVVRLLGYAKEPREEGHGQS